MLGYAAGMAVTYVVLPLVARARRWSWAPLLGARRRRCSPSPSAASPSLYPALRAGKMDPTEALRAL